jgi:hypothetical protein
MSKPLPKHPHAWGVTKRLVKLMELETDAENIVDNESHGDEEDREGWHQVLLDVRKAIQGERAALHQHGWCYPETIEHAKIMCSVFGRYAARLSDAEKESAVALLNELGRRQGLLA